METKLLCQQNITSLYECPTSSGYCHMARRTYTIVFVSFLGVVLLTIVYLSPSVGNAFWDTLRLPQTAAAKCAVEPDQEREFLDQRQSKSVTKEGGISLTNRTQGYVIGRLYEQQMTSGLNDFFELSNITAGLNLSTVEPFVQGTYIKGIPDIKHLGGDNKFWKLSMFYDRHHLQTILNNCSSLRQLVSFDTILTKASRDVVLVYFFTSDSKHFKQYFSGKNCPVVEVDHKKANRNARVIQTLKALNILTKHFSKLQQKQLPLFSHSRIVLVDARSSHPYHLSLAMLTEVLGSIISEEVSKSGSVTFVFDTWKGIHKKKGSPYFYFMPDFKLNASACGLRTIHHSKAVIEATHKFSQSLNQTRPVIGVHIRGEWLLIAAKGHFSHCVQQLESLLQTLTNASKIPNERVHVFHDFGHYGTKTCTGKSCTSGRSKLLSQINALGYPVSSYNPTMLNSVPVSPAFASFVEREYLAHVDILVTVGKGGFQNTIVARFLQLFGGNRANLHRICFS